jgi:ATP-dependent helicase HepA
VTFFPNQRYTSEGEPELGVGIVRETSKGRVLMHFPIADETRLYAIEAAPLRRISFKPGDTIFDSKNKNLRIERIEQENHLFIYHGDESTLSEKDLGNVSVKHGVDDKLLMGDVEAPVTFALRREALQHDYRRRISAVKGFEGGRIDLIPHQLYIAHEVSRRYAPRVLLSDQVGLGKTIEACLILHRLLLSGRIARVLILVPNSLVHQWFVELLRRFNLWFNIFNEERCVALDNNAPDGNPFLDDQLIICSIDFLADSKKRTQQALAASWDMLVVDEAHHLEWSIDKISPEYEVVELLSKVAKGLLLLTATPEQLGQESHFARLRLIDPNRYGNYIDFVNEANNHKNIATVVEKLSLNKSLLPKETKLLEANASKERISAVLKGDEWARQNLIEDLLDQHGPGRVLFRNTRRTMSGFPKRKAHLAPLKVSHDHSICMERLTHEFISDLKPLTDDINEQAFGFTEDPRIHWLLSKMKDLHPEKVLLICKSKAKVLALEETLSKLARFKVGVFHEELTIVQRDRNAAWFSEPDGARILLCSEIGSEGRNFQFAHHLILFDLPLHPELLEQRIGRLDRIGQTETIHIHVPFVTNTPQQKWVRWYHESLNAFESNVEGGNLIFKLFGERLLLYSQTQLLAETDIELETLIAETLVFKNELKTTLAKGHDKLLEMNSFRPKIAKTLVEKIQYEDSDKTLELFFTKTFEHFNVEMEDLALRSYLLHSKSINTEVFPSIPKSGLSVTFDRKRALSREDITFLTWDHPMTTDALDLIFSSGTGSASFGILRGTGKPGLLLEALFVLETAGQQNNYVDRFLPNTPLRIVVDHSGKLVTNTYTVENLNKQLIPGSMDALLNNEALMESIIPHMIAEATLWAEEQGQNEKINGLKRMNQTLDYEIERLNTLQKKNKDIRPEEIQTALLEKANLTALIKNARIRLDALLLIQKN